MSEDNNYARETIEYTEMLSVLKEIMIVNKQDKTLNMYINFQKICFSAVKNSCIKLL